MSRRIDVELTSARDDGTWTWRAAGARQPKGELDGALLPPGASVGDVFRAEAEFYMDGIAIVAILPPKETRREVERLTVLGSSRPEALVTTRVAEGARRRGRRNDREGLTERRAQSSHGRRATRTTRREREEKGERGQRDDSRRGDGRRPLRPAPEPRARSKRLKPGRAHRNAALRALPELQRPIAELILRGGIPAVRQAIDKQNALARAEGKPLVDADRLLALAEQMLPALRSAEWHDRAVAALAQVEEIDLRDLRSVVVAADASARDDETRTLAQQLRDALTERVDREHRAWLDELVQLLDEGRVVRALKLSSRPPKAGAPLPPEVSERLVSATNASLTGDVSTERWIAVLDALSFSPVRHQVKPEGLPDQPDHVLMTAVRRLANRLPEIAAQFGIEAPTRLAGAPSGKPVPRPQNPAPDPRR
ncbi:MAG: FUSC family protein [Acidimicrobiales bacterium]|nr:FUSC family protein [Acidimicrobiales bacterium]